jgi:hypothetical protein
MEVFEMDCVLGNLRGSFGDVDVPSTIVWAGVELEVRRLKFFGGGGWRYWSRLLGELEGGTDADGDGKWTAVVVAGSEFTVDPGVLVLSTPHSRRLRLHRVGID